MLNGYLSQQVLTSLGLKPSTSNTTEAALTSEYDMAGFDGALFTFILGNTTGQAVFTCDVQGSTASGGSYAVLGGATVTTTTGQGDQIITIDVKREHGFRYLKGELHRNTANSGHGGVIVQQYGARVLPITPSTTLYSTGLRVESTT